LEAVHSESDRGRGDQPPAPSSLVALEVALLRSDEHAASDAPVALVVASDDDERAYVADALRQRADLFVVAATTVAEALEAAVRRAPRVVVATHEMGVVVRHLPAVAAVLLSDDAWLASAVNVGRLAPLVVFRGAFQGAELLEVVTALLDGGHRAG